MDVVLESSRGSSPHRGGGSVPTVLPCLSVQRGLFSCRVVVGAHMRTMILCGGLAYKTEQMAHPLPVAWGPRASQAAFAVAIWQCGLVACASCAVPACDLVCSEFNTSLVAGQWWLCALRLFLWNLSDLALMGFCLKLTCSAMIFILIRSWDMWKHSACIPAAVSTCMQLNLVHQC